jgi:hypothetical protein
MSGVGVEGLDRFKTVVAVVVIVDRGGLAAKQEM